MLTNRAVEILASRISIWQKLVKFFFFFFNHPCQEPYWPGGSLVRCLQLSACMQLLELHDSHQQPSHDSQFSMRADGRLLQSHKKLQELSDLRGIDYLHSDGLYPEIGPELASLDALKTKINEVPCFAQHGHAVVGSARAVLLQWLGFPCFDCIHSPFLLRALANGSED